jgi:hypothetical protein
MSTESIVAVFVDGVPAFYSEDEENAKNMAVKLFERMIEKMSDASAKFYIEFLNNVLTMSRVDRFSAVCYDNIVHTANFYRIRRMPSPDETEEEESSEDEEDGSCANEEREEDTEADD